MKDITFKIKEEELTNYIVTNERTNIIERFKERIKERNELIEKSKIDAFEFIKDIVHNPSLEDIYKLNMINERVKIIEERIFQLGIENDRDNKEINSLEV